MISRMIKPVILALFTFLFLPVSANSQTYVMPEPKTNATFQQVGYREHYHRDGYRERHPYHHNYYHHHRYWVPGHWIYHPRTHHKVWIPGHWERRW